MGQWTSWRPPWAHSSWTGGKPGGIPSANYFTVWLWIWALKICPAWGTTCSICPLLDYSAYRWTFPTFKQNDFQTFLLDTQNILFRTILHSIHQPSQHGHPTPQKIHLNPKIWPFFEHALGTHILCSPLLYNWPPHWNKRVSFPRTVFLPVISTSFCHTRWERSVTDAQMLEAGLHAGFDISNGYYYLADVGYPPTSKMSWLPIVVVPSCQMELSWTKVSDLPLNLEPVWMQTIHSSDII